MKYENKIERRIFREVDKMTPFSKCAIIMHLRIRVGKDRIYSKVKEKWFGERDNIYKTGMLGVFEESSSYDKILGVSKYYAIDHDMIRSISKRSIEERAARNDNLSQLLNQLKRSDLNKLSAERLKVEPVAGFKCHTQYERKIQAVRRKPVAVKTKQSLQQWLQSPRIPEPKHRRSEEIIDDCLRECGWVLAALVVLNDRMLWALFQMLDAWLSQSEDSPLQNFSVNRHMTKFLESKGMSPRIIKRHGRIVTAMSNLKKSERPKDMAIIDISCCNAFIMGAMIFEGEEQDRFFDIYNNEDFYQYLADISYITRAEARLQFCKGCSWEGMMRYDVFKMLLRAFPDGTSNLLRMVKSYGSNGMNRSFWQYHEANVINTASLSIDFPFIPLNDCIIIDRDEDREEKVKNIILDTAIKLTNKKVNLSTTHT